MADYSEDVRAKVDGLLATPGFDGLIMGRVITGHDGSGEPQYQAILSGPPGLCPTGLRALATTVLDRLEDVNTLSTANVIDDLVTRPGFRGVVIQEQHHEAGPILGRTRVHIKKTPRLPLEELRQLLRSASAIIDSEIKKRRKKSG